MKQRNRGLLHSFSTLGLTSFLGLFVCLLILAGLGWLCQEVWEREAFSFDKAFMMWVHQWSSPLLDKFMIGATRLGDPEIVVSVILVNLVWFLVRGRRYTALMLIVACTGALALNVGLKLVFARPRPVLWPHLINEASYGFPSGHALGSLVLYGFLAYVFACWYPRQSGWIYGIATGTVALIGLSRIYLGVHFPTDILAGYSVGILWLVFCINIPEISGASLTGGKERDNRCG
jgi:membrane-associated phospholipid phosphatase